MANLVNLRSVQFLRFVAAIYVVLTHAHLYLSANHSFIFTPVFDRFFEYGPFGVHIFFVISGFIMVFTSRNKFGQARAPQDFLARRFIRIFPTYWFYFLATLFVIYLTGANDNTGAGSYVMSLFLAPKYSSLVIPIGWTLTYEVYFYLIFSVFLIFPMRAAVVSIACFFVFSVAMRVFLDTSHPTIDVVTNTLLLEFIFGALIGYLFVRELNVGKNIAALALVLGIVWFAITAVLDLRELGSVLVWGIPAALILFGSVFFERAVERPVVVKLAWLGDSSYTVYLSHILLLPFIIAAGKSLGFLQLIGGELSVLVIAVIVQVYALFAYEYIERPMTKSLQNRYKQYRADRLVKVGN